MVKKEYNEDGTNLFIKKFVPFFVNAERFLSKHKCKACGAPMTYIHGNVMACKNPECKGIEIKREDKDGNEMVSYINSFCTLDDLGAEIASNIFSE